MVKSINTDSSIYIHPLLYLVKYPLVSCNLTKCFWYPSTSFWQYSGWIFNHFSWQNWWNSFKLVSFLAQTWLFSRVEVWTLGSPFQKPSGPFLNNCTFRCHQFKELFECVTTLPWSARRPKLSPSDDRKLVRVFRNHQGLSLSWSGKCWKTVLSSITVHSKASFASLWTKRVPTKKF